MGMKAKRSARSSRVYILKAKWIQEYPDPDEGLVNVGEVFDIIAISSNRSILKALAEDLKRGHDGENWSLKRSRELKRIYPGYDHFMDTEFVIEDVTNLVV